MLNENSSTCLFKFYEVKMIENIFIFVSFIKFMFDSRIIHQLCSYTSQYNGLVERKSRHMLEAVRSMLFHMNVPMKY